MKQTLPALLAALLLATLAPAIADPVDALVDDFSDAAQSSLGTPRIFLDDTSAGGRTEVRHSVSDGRLLVSGQITPPRGQPGWASTVLLLDAEGLPRDASRFRGLRLRLRIRSGNLSVSANSAEIDNFDYHAAVVERRKGDDFQEVTIPFASMQRRWSAQTPLKPAKLLSISLVAFGLQPGPFDFEIDEVTFYE